VARGTRIMTHPRFKQALPDVGAETSPAIGVIITSVTLTPGRDHTLVAMVDRQIRRGDRSDIAVTRDPNPAPVEES
jgi:hypothetical protein